MFPSDPSLSSGQPYPMILGDEQKLKSDQRKTIKNRRMGSESKGEGGKRRKKEEKGGRRKLRKIKEET